MLGIALKDKEAEEMIYLLKKEMDDVYEDLQDQEIEACVKRAIKEKYGLLFSVYSRMVPAVESKKYDLSLAGKRNMKKT